MCRYHCNITDVDDKIIARARQNKLIANFVEANGENWDVVAEHVARAVAEQEAALTLKLAKLEAAPVVAAKGVETREVDAYNAAVGSQKLKLTQIALTKKLIACVTDAKAKGAEAYLTETLSPQVAALAAAGAAVGTAAEMIAALSTVMEETEGAAKSAASDLRDMVAIVGAMLARANEEGEKLAAQSAPATLLQAARSEVGGMLDRELGSTVTDHAIFDAHARKFEKSWLDDMAALGVKEPDVLTRVTEYIPQIVTYVAKIVEKGLAYASPGGSVYLSIEAFKASGHSYRKLSPGKETSAEDMAESEGALGGAGGAAEKRHANDFALWKASKPGEPFWESPWGNGRPGWHIECSVVASDILGPNMDFHAGGVDLKFPHHDNEMAQSEAYWGCNQWVNYFLHAGHLHIKGLKMSKSLKNFIKIKEALKEHSPRQLRIMFLLQPWDKPMNYSDQVVSDAREKERVFRSFFGVVKDLVRSEAWLQKKIGWANPDADRELYLTLATAQDAVHAAFCNNFDTKGAMDALLTLVNAINAYLRTNSECPAIYLVQNAARYVTRILRVVGVVTGSDDIGFRLSEGGAAGGEEAVAPYISALVDFRKKVREAARSKQSLQTMLDICDEVRDTELIKLGVRIEDKGDGTSLWKREEPAVLRRELQEKRDAEAAKKAAKAKKKIVALEKAIKLAEGNKASPLEQFKTEKFSAWGDDGAYTMKHVLENLFTLYYFLPSDNIYSYPSSLFKKKLINVFSTPFLLFLSFPRRRHTGIPTKTADGEDVKKSQTKKMSKQMAKSKKNHDKLVAAAAKEGLDDVDAYIETMRASLANLKLL